MGIHRNSPEFVFGRRVREEREDRGWSQAALADEMGKQGVDLHASAVAKIEARSAQPPRAIRLDEAVAIARAFGKPLDDLVEETDDVGVIRRAVDRAEREYLHAVRVANRAAKELEREQLRLAGTISLRLKTEEGDDGVDQEED